MASINFMGSYSGIDQNTINQLMEVERLPLKKLESRKEDTVKMQNAWRDVNTRMNTLFEKMKALESADTFSSKAVTSTDESVITATANRNAMNAEYDLKSRRSQRPLPLWVIGWMLSPLPPNWE